MGKLCIKENTIHDCPGSHEAQASFLRLEAKLQLNEPYTKKDFMTCGKVMAILKENDLRKSCQTQAKQGKKLVPHVRGNFATKGPVSARFEWTNM